jgi:hypothetical protein
MGRTIRDHCGVKSWISGPERVTQVVFHDDAMLNRRQQETVIAVTAPFEAREDYNLTRSWTPA